MAILEHQNIVNYHTCWIERREEKKYDQEDTSETSLEENNTG